jgi:hypothetical protein
MTSTRNRETTHFLVSSQYLGVRAGLPQGDLRVRLPRRATHLPGTQGACVSGKGTYGCACPGGQPIYLVRKVLAFLARGPTGAPAQAGNRKGLPLLFEKIHFFPGSASLACLWNDCDYNTNEGARQGGYILKTLSLFSTHPNKLRTPTADSPTRWGCLARNQASKTFKCRKQA